MSLDFGTHASAAGGVDKALQRAADVGATSCQIFSKNERQWVGKPLMPDVVERFWAERERLQIRQMSVHDSYLINLASNKPELHDQSIMAFADEHQRCRELGIEYLVTHPGAHTGAGAEAGIQRVADALNRIHDTMPDNPTITCLENTAGQGTALGATFDELAAIIELVEDKHRVGVCFDTCHAFAAGYDLRDEETVRATFDEFERVLGMDRLRLLHLNDSIGELGSHRDRHAHIGQGQIGVEGFRALVNDPRLDGLPGMMETEKDASGDNDRANLILLRSLVGTAAGDPLELEIAARLAAALGAGSVEDE